MSVTLRNVLFSITTGEVNAVASRCRGKQKVSTAPIPRTLVPCVEAISQILNTAKITNPSNTDSMINAWKGKLFALSIE